MYIIVVYAQRAYNALVHSKKKKKTIKKIRQFECPFLNRDTSIINKHKIGRFSKINNK